MSTFILSVNFLFFAGLSSICHVVTPHQADGRTPKRLLATSEEDHWQATLMPQRWGPSRVVQGERRRYSKTQKCSFGTGPIDGCDNVRHLLVRHHRTDRQGDDLTVESLGER